MEIVNQHLIKKDGKIIHSVFLIRELFQVEIIRKPPYLYRIISSLPFPIHLRYFQGRPNAFIEKGYAFLAYVNYIRFLDDCDLNEFQFNEGIPEKLRKNPKFIERTKIAWLQNLPPFRFASRTHNQHYFWALSCDIVSFATLYNSLYKTETQEISRKQFESLFEVDNDRDIIEAEYVNCYSLCDSYCQTDEGDYVVSWAISLRNGYEPLMFIITPK